MGLLYIIIGNMDGFTHWNMEIGNGWTGCMWTD